MRLITTPIALNIGGLTGVVLFVMVTFKHDPRFGSMPILSASLPFSVSQSYYGIVSSDDLFLRKKGVSFEHHFLATVHHG